MSDPRSSTSSLAPSARGVLPRYGSAMMSKTVSRGAATLTCSGPSGPRSQSELGSGEATPAWSLPLIVVALAAAAELLFGWDAAVRVTAGCVLVGITQALMLERMVAADERETARTYFRIASSRILRGTRLGYTGAD